MLQYLTIVMSQCSLSSNYSKSILWTKNCLGFHVACKVGQCVVETFSRQRRAETFSFRAQAKPTLLKKTYLEEHPSKWKEEPATGCSGAEGDKLGLTSGPSQCLRPIEFVALEAHSTNNSAHLLTGDTIKSLTGNRCRS